MHQIDASEINIKTFRWKDRSQTFPKINMRTEPQHWDTPRQDPNTSLGTNAWKVNTGQERELLGYRGDCKDGKHGHNLWVHKVKPVWKCLKLLKLPEAQQEATKKQKTYDSIKVYEKMKLCSL